MFTQPQTEMSTRYKKKKKKFLESRGQPLHEADFLTTISEPIVYTMLDPQHPTTL
jgi:hypothetical protein